MYKTETRKALIRLLTDILITAAFVAAVFTFVFGLTTQKGNDMYPALRDGDVILYYRHPALVITESIVYEMNGELRSGRIAAVPGCVISQTGDRQLTVNGSFQPEDPEHGIYTRTETSDELELPLQISPDGYFVLNDNRTRMSDSRIYGEISRSQIKGRIITVLRRRNI